MEPIKLTLTDDGKLTGEVELPRGSAEEPGAAPGTRDLQPEEVVWRRERVDAEGRSLPANSLFPSGFTSSADGGSFSS